MSSGIYAIIFKKTEGEDDSTNGMFFNIYYFGGASMATSVVNSRLD